MKPSYTSADYLSPFTWRYGTDDMRALWSQRDKHLLWRRIWVALAEVQCELGLVTPEQVEDLLAHVEDVDLERASEIEAEIRHDLMAEVRTYAEQCAVGGGVIHLGATSMDIEDNADALRIRDSLDQLIVKLADLILLVAKEIEAWADQPTMAFTHLQPAEPTTIGYRLAQYGQDLLQDFDDLRRLRRQIKGKGFKGATGTSASYATLLAGTGVTPAQFEQRVMARLGLPPVLAATQTSPRKQEYRVLCGLASLGQSLYKFAADLRLLQSPPIGEWAEPFGKHQVGSSAMPFKRNPINAENMDSLARLLAAMPRVAWDNAAHSYLERTLDDSANRRSLLPEAFLITDELLRRAARLFGGLRVDTRASDRLLERYGVFAATERVLMECVRRGGDRQELHEVIREHSLAAWAASADGQPNPLAADLAGDPRLLELATAQEIKGWLDARGHVGDAPERARLVAQDMKELARNLTIRPS
ncbi:MAG: adenylosuccinate lyase [Alphaproteobacteria bacterium]|nr:adenylosuccinate lyase [Alphaproteobacteria bacterium]